MIAMNGRLRSLVLVLLLAVPLTGRSAVPISPELQNATEAGRIKEINTRAEASLREKIEVGKQRYQEKQLFRKELVQGITSSAEERRQEISRLNLPSAPVKDISKFDINSLAWLLIFLGLIYQGVRYYRAQELGDLDLGMHSLSAGAGTEILKAAKINEFQWRNFVSDLQVPLIDCSQVEVHKQTGRFEFPKLNSELSVKLCLEIAPELQSMISEAQVREHLKIFFESQDIRQDENSNLWLVLVIQGSRVSVTNTISHEEKIVLFENDCSLKQKLTVALQPRWGAQYAAYADCAEIPGEVRAVINVFSEMFLQEFIFPQGAPADLPPPAIEASGDCVGARMPAMPNYLSESGV